MKPHQVLLRNAWLIDPLNGVDGRRDLAFAQGRVAGVSERIPPETAETVFDVGGLMVTPGLVDAHTHCYFSAGMARAWAGDYSIQPDYHSFRSGITTMVDTGSSGSLNFAHFKSTVIDRSATRVLALLNIADHGMSSLLGEQFPERNDENHFLEICRQYPKHLIGIKIAHYERDDWKDLECAQRLQRKIGLPIMVDFGVFKRARPYDELVCERLSAGDISTHCFRAPVPVLDPEGKVYPYLWRARERGIKFDLGHGAGSFLFRNAVPALRQGFFPDSISSDIHGLSINGPVVDLATTLSKVKACCQASWAALFRLATCSPAAWMRRPELGHLGIGAEADAAVWSVRAGHFGFEDAGGGVLHGGEKLECEMTWRAGELVWDLNARAGRDYRALPPLYGLNPQKEELVAPSDG